MDAKDFDDIFDEDDDIQKDIDIDELLGGEKKISWGQESMIEHLVECSNIPEEERKEISLNYSSYTEAEASACISMLKENMPLTDCRDQFIKMCKDGVFKTEEDC